MNLLELFHHLAVAELSNIAMANKWEGTIDEDHHPQLVRYVNDALLKLYTRFVLKESDLFLEQIGSRSTYPLLRKYALTQAEGLTWFIRDSEAEPFTQDIIKILSVHDGFGRQLPLNDPNSWGSVFTPQPTTLQIPHAADGRPLQVHYQANHPILSPKKLKIDLELPEILHSALRSYVAYKVYDDTNTQENVSRAQEHLSQFEASCVEMVDQDLIPTPNPNGGVRFEANGWV